MTARNYSSTATEVALVSTVSAAALAITVSSTLGLPLSVPYTLVIDAGTPGVEEIVTVTAVAGPTLTIVRGEDGTVAQTHQTGALIRHALTARDLREPQVHMEATQNIHGVGSGASVVGTTTTQTLTHKTLDGTANTITGLPSTALADGVVTTAKINASAVATAKIADAAVTTVKVADANITLAKLAAAVQANLPPAGAITAFAGSTAPSGWLLCDGSAVSRVTYAALFTAIGTTYGAGDGVTTFLLPNLKGKVVVGVDAAQTEFDNRGETGGEKTHILSAAEMPTHTHVQDAHTHTQKIGRSVAETSGFGLMPTPGVGFTDRAIVLLAPTVDTNVNVNDTVATNQNAGSSAAHNNLQPYIALHWLIRT